MAADGILVTEKEAGSAAVVRAVLERRLKLLEAAWRLGLSVRQVKCQAGRRFWWRTRKACGIGWTRPRRSSRGGRVGSRCRTIRCTKSSNLRRRRASRQGGSPRAEDGASELVPRFPSSSHRRISCSGDRVRGKTVEKATRANSTARLVRCLSSVAPPAKGAILLCVDTRTYWAASNSRLNYTSGPS